VLHGSATSGEKKCQDGKDAQRAALRKRHGVSADGGAAAGVCSASGHGRSPFPRGSMGMSSRSSVWCTVVVWAKV